MYEHTDVEHNEICAEQNMTNKQKVERTVEVYKELKKLWGDSTVGFDVHDVELEIKSLPKGWKITGNVIESTGHKYWSAKNEDCDGITLYD